MGGLVEPMWLAWLVIFGLLFAVELTERKKVRDDDD